MCDWECGGIIRGRLCVIGSVEESSEGVCDREGEGIMRGICDREGGEIIMGATSAWVRECGAIIMQGASAFDRED